jgi:hypothetical protein
MQQNERTQKKETIATRDVNARTRTYAGGTRTVVREMPTVRRERASDRQVGNAHGRESGGVAVWQVGQEGGVSCT